MDDHEVLVDGTTIIGRRAKITVQRPVEVEAFGEFRIKSVIWQAKMCWAVIHDGLVLGHFPSEVEAFASVNTGEWDDHMEEEVV